MKKTVSKFLLLTAVLFGSVFCSSPIKAVPVKATLIDQKKKFVENIELKTVGLIKEIDGSTAPYCSGVWVGQKEIITAFHCIREDEKIIDVVQYKMLSDKDMQPRTAKVVIFDFANDLVLLRDESKTIDPHPVAELAKEAWDGQHVNIVGHTGGLWWSYIDGVVSSLRKKVNILGQAQILIQVSAAVWMGNSGGGAWDDQGRLLGISSFVMPNIPLASFFIHLRHIRELMAAAPK